MSHWTHITACLSVETGIIAKRSDLRKKLNKYLKDAPKITGSEGDADVYVNIQRGHNFFTSRDCERCIYKDTIRDIKVDGEDWIECDAPTGHDCSAEYQTCVVISVQGDLRDRTKKQTQKEWNKFLKYIEKGNLVRDYSINIEGE